MGLGSKAPMASPWAPLFNVLVVARRVLPPPAMPALLLAFSLAAANADSTDEKPPPAATESEGAAPMSRGVRIPLEVLGAALGLAVPSAVVFASAAGRGLDYNVWIPVWIGLALIEPLTVAGGAYFFHNLGGGKGGFGPALASVVLSGFVAAAIYGMSMATLRVQDYQGWAIGLTSAIGGTLVLASAPLTLELFDTLDRSRLQVGVTPVRGGAAGTLSFSF
jgi:hypothetical protein